MQCPASGPALWAGGDSPLPCSRWSWRTASSWTRHSLWEMTSLCAASRNQQRWGRGKETLQTRPSSTWDTFILGSTHTFSTGPLKPNHKAASNYIKMYHTAKSVCKWGRLVMFLKTWSAAAWLDETVFIATVLAKSFGWCCPQLNGHDHLLIAVVWMWLAPGKIERKEGSSWYNKDCIIYTRGRRGRQTEQHWQMLVSC